MLKVIPTILLFLLFKGVDCLFVWDMKDVEACLIMIAVKLMMCDCLKRTQSSMLNYDMSICVG